MFILNTNGTDLKAVSSLHELMPSLVKGFDIVGVHDNNDFDYNPYSILHIDGDIDINKPDFPALFNKYPTISILEHGFKEEYKLLRIQKKYVQADKQYTIADLNDKIKVYNSTLKMSKKNEFLKERAACLEWRAYNTPNSKDISITPLHGTFFPYVDLKDKSSLNIYIQWKISSYMLIWEYNVLNKAKKYMDNLESNTSQPSAYKDCFEYWKNRQIVQNIEDPELFKQGTYIRDFTVDLDHLYTEICEDFLYVMLNIILAKTIINEVNINDYVGSSESEFDSKIKSIMNLHHQKYEEYYTCLNSIRISYIENYMSESNLKDFSRKIAADLL